MAAVDQQHVVIGQAREALLHQGAHVVHAAHLFRQQDQRSRCVVALKGLHLDGDLVVVERGLEQIPQAFAAVFAFGIGDAAVFVLQRIIQLGIHPLELQFLMAIFQPRDELGVDEGVGQQHLSALPLPERQGAGLPSLIGAVKDALVVVSAQA